MEEHNPSTQPEPAHQRGTGKGEEKVKTEGKEAGRKDTGREGADRPVGKTMAESSTGVNPKDPIDPKSPHLPTP